VIDLVSQVRTLRAELNIPWSATLEPVVLGGGATVERINAEAATLSRLAKLGRASASQSAPAGSAQVVVGGDTIAFPLGGHIDLDTEKARLAKAAEAAEKDRDSLAARLANPAFAERAKPEAVEKARADHRAKWDEAERLRAALERLG
jgi:valyl-tRNA synthetase